MTGYFRTFKLITANKLLVNTRYAQPNFQPSVMGLKKETKEKFEALNLPAKPKKPLSAYLKYLMNNRPQLEKEHPNLKSTEIVKLAAEKWRSLPEKDKETYIKNYSEEMLKFNSLFEQYKASLTKEQTEILQEVRQEHRHDKKKRQLKKTLKELEKPKRPMAMYNLFLLERAKQLNKGVNVLMRELKEEWAALPQEEKEKYRYQYKKEKENYDKELDKWEIKMIQEGHENLVRRKSIEEKRPVLLKNLLQHEKSKPKKSTSQKENEKSENTE